MLRPKSSQVFTQKNIYYILLYNYYYVTCSILTESQDQEHVNKSSYISVSILVLKISLKQSKSIKYLTSFLRHYILYTVLADPAQSVGHLGLSMWCRWKTVCFEQFVKWSIEMVTSTVLLFAQSKYFKHKALQEVNLNSISNVFAMYQCINCCAHLSITNVNTSRMKSHPRSCGDEILWGAGCGHEVCLCHCHTSHRSPHCLFLPSTFFGLHLHLAARWFKSGHSELLVLTESI